LKTSFVGSCKTALENGKGILAPQGHLEFFGVPLSFR